MQTTLSIRLFGGLQIDWLNVSQAPKLLPKTPSLLAYLLLHRTEVLSRAQVAYKMWPDVPEQQAKANLRRHVQNLRQALPQPSNNTAWLLASRKTIQWNPRAAYWLDVAAFEQFSQQAEDRAKAADLYRGALLPTIDEEWLWLERERLRSLQMNNLRQLINQQRQNGRFEQALTYVHQALADDPLREEMMRDLLALSYALGERTEAMRVYQQFVHRLDTELGVAPMEATIGLAKLIRSDAPLADVFRALGDEGGKVGEKTAVSSPQAPPHTNLPAPMRQIIGREMMLQEIEACFQNDTGVRLLTLTGAGGIGKTTLTLAAARRLRQQQPALFPDGLFFVPLAALTAADLVLTTIADVLEIPLGTQPVLERLIEELRYKRLLLLLDNFEHVLHAASDIAHLLAALPNLHLLITSQAGLNIYGEHELSVLPLAVPARPKGDKPLSSYSAIALFVAGAKAANGRFELTDENSADVFDICHQLDGLPLAIELAAARCRHFTPVQIVAQLANALSFLRTKAVNVPERHRTLRAALGWSYGLLSAAEKRLLNPLSLFSGSFSPNAVAYLCGATDKADPNEPEHDILEQLIGLTDKHLIAQASSEATIRFSMLTMVRSFVREMVAENGRLPQLETRYAAYYATLGAQAKAAKSTSISPTWLQLLRLEEENIQAAISSCLRPDATADLKEVGAQLLLGWDHGFYSLGRLAETKKSVEQLLIDCNQMPLPIQAELYTMAARYALGTGASQATITNYLEKSITLARQLDNPYLLVDILTEHGTVQAQRGQLDEAAELYREALSGNLDNSSPSILKQAVIQQNLATILHDQKKHAEALTLLKEILLIAKRLEESSLETSTLLNMGNNYRRLGDYANSIGCQSQVHRHLKNVPNRIYHLVLLSQMAELAFLLQHHEQSTRWHSAMQSLSQQVSLAWPANYQQEFADYVQKTRQAMPDRLFLRHWAEGSALSFEQILTETEVWLDKLPK